MSSLRDQTAPIECGHVTCGNPAVTGGIVVVQPNGLQSTHAVYYACDNHPGILRAALETWQVRHPGAALRETA